MTFNAVIRCSTCNRISPKRGSMFGVCKWCLEIEKLKKENEALVKNLSMIQEYYGVQKSDYFDNGSWHKISEKESKQITKQARIFHGDGKL